MVYSKKKILLFCLLVTGLAGFGQAPLEDSLVNNLVLPPGYATSEYGSIPSFVKAGKGKQALILIPGLGFDSSVFADFIESNQNTYTIYAITIPGYGRTSAPSLPPVGTSYGDQYWNKGIVMGILKLMQQEKIEKPFIIGHFVQASQLVLRMAIDYGDKVRGVIVIGGPAKFILVQNGEPKEFPLKGSIAYVDNFTAPKFFANISKEIFDAGNYSPRVYSTDTLVGEKLWQQAAAVPLPVTIQYLCEFFASDVSLEANKIKCPVLILRAKFTPILLSQPKNPATNYLKSQFIDAWDRVAGNNSLVQIKDVENTGVFIWKDQLKVVNESIKRFIHSAKN